ncbi:hypothetical protein HKX48_007191 [Thoreauomyces humboldtii]|nr:hypothetical protein HKX48_007191 [Thoreauomyces humboldtii]
MKTSLSRLALAAAGLVALEEAYAASSTCFQLKGSSTCPDLASFFISNSSAFSDVASFDAYMNGNSIRNASYVSEFKSDFGCSGWDGHNQRYQASTSCFLGVHSNSDIFANTTACPVAATAATQSLDQKNQDLLTGSFTAFCNKLSDSTSSCTQGLKSELGMCGFSYFADAQSYCSTTTGQADACCLLVASLATTSSSALSAAVPSSITDPIHSLPYVASGIALAVMVVVSAAFIFCIKVRPWRKASTTAIEPPSSDVTPGPFGTYGTLSRSGTVVKGVDSNGGAPFRGGAPQRKSLMQSFRRSIMGQKPTRIDPGLPTTAPTIKKMNPQSMYSNADTLQVPRSPAPPLPSFQQGQNVQSMYSNAAPRSPAPPMPAYMPQQQQQQQQQSYVFDDPMPVAPAAEGPLGGFQMRVGEAYVGQLADELSLQVGDIVTVEEEFDDGWATGRNESTGEVGAFPFACLDAMDAYSQYNEQGGRATNSVVRERGVSLYASQAQF